MGIFDRFRGNKQESGSEVPEMARVKIGTEEAGDEFRLTIGELSINYDTKDEAEEAAMVAKEFSKKYGSAQEIRNAMLTQSQKKAA